MRCKCDAMMSLIHFNTLLMMSSCSEILLKICIAMIFVISWSCIFFNFKSWLYVISCIFVKIIVDDDEKNFFNNMSVFLIESISDNMNEWSCKVNMQIFLEILFFAHLHAFHMLSDVSHFFSIFFLYCIFMILAITWFTWFLIFLYAFHSFSISFLRWYFLLIVLIVFEICLHFFVNFDFEYTFDLLSEMNISMIVCIVFINSFIWRLISSVWLLNTSFVDESVSLFDILTCNFSRKTSTFVFF